MTDPIPTAAEVADEIRKAAKRRAQALDLSSMSINNRSKVFGYLAGGAGDLAQWMTAADALEASETAQGLQGYSVRFKRPR